MTATKQKVIYFMRPNPLNSTVSDVSNICFPKKNTKLTVQFLLKAYIRWAKCINVLAWRWALSQHCLSFLQTGKRVWATPEQTQILQGNTDQMSGNVHYDHHWTLLCCLKHRCQIWRSAANQTNYLCTICGSSCSLVRTRSLSQSCFSTLFLPTSTLFAHPCSKINQIKCHPTPITLEWKWLEKPSYTKSAQTTTDRPTKPSLSNILIKTWRRHKLECLQNQMKPSLILKRLEDLSVVYAKVKCCCKDWKAFKKMKNKRCLPINHTWIYVYNKL